MKRPSLIAILTLPVFLIGCSKEDKPPEQVGFINIPTSSVPDMTIVSVADIPIPKEVANIPKFTKAYLLMGQSNMNRNCGGSAPNIIPELGCSTGQYLPEYVKDPDALYINCARGGTEMARWSVSGDLYQSCVSLADRKTLDIKAVFFFQGENDAINGLSVPDWSNAFEAMVSNIRIRTNNPILPVIFAQIGSGRNDEDWVTIQTEQESINIPYCAMVLTRDIPPHDGVHFTESGYREIASRMADSLGKLKTH